MEKGGDSQRKAKTRFFPFDFPRGELAPKTKRRRSDEDILKVEHIRSERYAGHTLKYEGTHSSLASKSLSEGDPYKRLKRALSAESKKWTFEIDDYGSMFDCSVWREKVVFSPLCDRVFV